RSDGSLLGPIGSFVDYFQAETAASDLALGNRMRMLTQVHDTVPPPDYPYTRALSAHSAVIQLYARLGIGTVRTVYVILRADTVRYGSDTAVYGIRFVEVTEQK
ncbi:hypothetical protein DFH06DRAFT_1204214, partial [Mycena polygramma]